MSTPETIERAQLYLANGYPPVPILRHDAPGFIEKNGKRIKQTPGKQPHGILWARKEELVYSANPDTLRGWKRFKDIDNYPGLGIACGRIAASDIDVYEPELADRVETLAVELLGSTLLRRVGQAPKRLLVYRVEGEPLNKRHTPELLKGELKAKVEVLGRGQQFVAFGVHPATGLPFAWGEQTPETTPLAELPAVTPTQVEAFVEAAERLLRAAGYRTRAEIEAEAAPAPAPPATRPAERRRRRREPVQGAQRRGAGAARGLGAGPVPAGAARRARGVAGVVGRARPGARGGHQHRPARRGGPGRHRRLRRARPGRPAAGEEDAHRPGAGVRRRPRRQGRGGMVG
jgi:hypothetical protein